MTPTSGNDWFDSYRAEQNKHWALIHRVAYLAELVTELREAINLPAPNEES